MVLAVLRGAVNLGQGDNGNLQLLGQRLEPAANLGDLLLTRIAAVVRLDQLQIIDDDELDAVAQLQAAGIGGDAQHALHRRIIDEQLGVAQYAAGVDETVHVVGVERALTHAMAVHAGLATEQTLGQFNPRLFETDEENRLFFVNDDITDYSERE